MGATIHFKEMLPTPPVEAHGVTNAKRQFEVLTYAGDVWLRTGAPGREDAAEGRASVAVTAEFAADLLRELQTALRAMGKV